MTSLSMRPACRLQVGRSPSEVADVPQQYWLWLNYGSKYFVNGNFRFFFNAFVKAFHVTHTQNGVLFRLDIITVCPREVKIHWQQTKLQEL